ncbi:hypothetical protein GE061_012841 [Apolygus lucorum]|uniref:Uncharacterized protein n=1 Tax=Apolygus lucorum TaxID=248454 RepID=A0A8S9XUT5_APOLU|nr:hypothetical protein GE061_012841 [Apolygus lucorum]
MKAGGVFHIWAATPPDNLVRTTNGAESYHTNYNRQFYAPHPNVHMVGYVLKEIQCETALKIKSIQRGCQNTIRSEMKQHTALLLECWEMFLEERDVIKFLSHVANRYKPICEEDFENSE